MISGDRILSVNGEMIEGKSYASVVQMIQNTADRLLLMVVPKEDDVIQQVSKSKYSVEVLAPLLGRFFWQFVADASVGTPLI